MNATEQGQLQTRIAKESTKCYIKKGETNGRLCVHAVFAEILNDQSERVREARSITLYEPSEWEFVSYPYNESKRPRRDKKDREDDAAITSAVANREAI